MKFVRHLLLLACILGVFSTSALAQAGMQTVDLGDGYQISVPASWEIDDSREEGVIANNPDLNLAIFTPAMLESLVNDIQNAADAVDALTRIAEADDLGQIDTANIEKMQVGERTTAAFTNEQEGSMLVALPIGDSFGLLVFIAEADVFAAQEDMIEQIIASFDVVETASAGGDCTVSAAAANSAALRVGPGENRSSISFLPANTDVTVTGRNELDDGSVWYQLDKAEAAPGGSAAAELWVNAEDVEANGGCDSVGDTSAPPVIPISVAPPPAATAAPGEPAPEPVQSGALPAAGFWTLNLNPTTNASCLGYENVPYSTSEVYTSPFFTGPLNIVNSGAFDFNGDVFRRVGSSNSFTGTITFDVEGGGSMVTQVRFDLASSTRMTGQIVANYNADDGTPCSDTVVFAATLG
ncbi:MAG TPA: hypothetical protein VER79_02580 [Candidatus Limnocylindrales bacterium]|nr:hypothetical protein [Candidatus Limnocylindrales bacterium]